MSDAPRTSDRPRDDARPIRVALLVVGLGVLFAVLPFLSGLIGALILYTVVRSVHARLARVVPARISAFALTVGVCFVILVPGTWLLSQIVSELGDAIRAVRTGELVDVVSRSPLGQFAAAREMTGIVANVISWFSDRAVSAFGNVALTVINLVVALFGLYYLLVEAVPLWQRIKRLLPVSDEIAEQLAMRFATVTEALLIGTALTAVLQGTIVGVSFAIVGLEPALLWGFVTACASLFPLFGSALVWLPGAIVLLLQHRSGSALFVAVTGAGLASNLDNLVRLVVYKRISGIHPMVTLVGAFAGVHLFGLVGALIGPLLISYFLELLRVLEDARALHERST